jgi:hypothetical protein
VVQAVKLNVGCGKAHFDGWCNTDASSAMEPDLLWDVAKEPYPEPETADAVLLSHVLEHLWWSDVPHALTHCFEALKSGGVILAIGPDVYRSLEMWRDGTLDWKGLLCRMEHPATVYNDHENPTSWDEGTPFDGYRHRWNCTGKRVVWGLETVGFVKVSEIEMDSAILDEWPVASRDRTQFAAVGTKP